MGLRRNLFHLFLYNVSTFLTIATTLFVVTPIATRTLSPDEFGVVKSLQMLSNVLLIFFSLYMSSAYTRFYYDHRARHEDLAALTSTSVYFLMALGVVLIGPAYLASELFLNSVATPNKSYTVILLALIPLTNIFMSLAAISTAYQNQVHQNVSVNVVTAIATLSSAGLNVLGLVVWRLGEQSFFQAALLSSVIQAGYGFYVLIRARLLVRTFSMRMLRDSLGLSVAGLPFSVCSWVWNASDHLLLAIFGSVALTGKYGLTYSVAMVLQTVYNQFWRVANPYLMGYLAGHDEGEKRHLLRLMDVYYLILAGGGLFLIFFGRRILFLLAPAEYQLDPWILTMCVLAYVLLGIRKYTDTIQWYHKRLWAMFIFGGLIPSMLNFGMNLVLIPRLFEYAAALSTLITSAVALGISIYMNGRLEAIPWRPRASAMLAGVLLAGVGAHGWLVREGVRSLWIEAPIFVLLSWAAFVSVGGWSAIGSMRRASQASPAPTGPV